MPDTSRSIGFWCGVLACAATVAYDFVQLLQLAGVLRFPLDEVLIYGTALAIVAPFMILMAAFHTLTGETKRFWTLVALLFTVLYAMSVTANYVVQLATVIPAKLRGEIASVHMLEQTPHSLFWDFDAIGYFAMGLALLAAVPALGRTGIEKWTRYALVANALTLPLIGYVYFHPGYSPDVLWIGAPWGVTAPLAMLLLALTLRRRPEAASP